MKKMKKTILFFGTIAIVLLMISSATAVPNTNSNVVTKRLETNNSIEQILEKSVNGFIQDLIAFIQAIIALVQEVMRLINNIQIIAGIINTVLSLIERIPQLINDMTAVIQQIISIIKDIFSGK